MIFVYTLLSFLVLGGVGAAPAASEIVERRALDLHARHPHAHLRNYTDHRRLFVRPLMHLGLSEPIEQEEEGYPLLYITSAFLDTRPFLQGKNAILRTVLMARVIVAQPPKMQPEFPDIFSWPLHCLWTMGRKGEHGEKQLLSSQLSPISQGYYRSGYKTHTYIGSCDTNVSEVSMRAGEHVPRFVTVARESNTDHIHSLSWVHVEVVPLVAEDSQEVQQNYSWKSTSGRDFGGGSGPFLTPKKHEDGDGEIAVCTSTPLVSKDDHHAAYLPQWLSFQKIIGVSKVIVYLLDPGPAELKLLEHYEQQGLVDIWSFRLSRHLINRKYLNDSNACGTSGSYNLASVKEHGGQHWLKCTNLYKLDIYWLGQLANTAHCHYSTMARYRWVVFHDFDEWLVPKLHPAVGYSAMLKRIRAEPANLLDSSDEGAADFGQDNASWPVSFMFRLGTSCHGCSPVISGIRSTLDWADEHHLNHAPRHVVLPDPAVPKSWIEPRPSLHRILWTSAVQGATKPVRDRGKNIIDPLAVMIMDVHDVMSAFTTDSNHSSMLGGGIRIPSGRRRSFVCASPDTAGMVVHNRVDHGMSRQVLGLWREKQIAWNAAGSEASKRRVEDIYGDPINLNEVCGFCDCAWEYCQKNETKNIVDFSLTNLYGALIVSEVEALIKSDFRVPLDP